MPDKGILQVPQKKESCSKYLLFTVSMQNIRNLMDYCVEKGALMLSPSAVFGLCLQIDSDGLLTLVETDDPTLVSI